MAQNPAVMAVVVVYRPDFAVLNELLQSLSKQVIHTYLIDNSVHDDFRVQGWLGSTTRENVSLIRLESNRGVATALNAGIRAACSAGATHVLLSDQDSLPAPDIIHMTSSHIRL